MNIASITMKHVEINKDKEADNFSENETAYVTVDSFL